LRSHASVGRRPRLMEAQLRAELLGASDHRPLNRWGLPFLTQTELARRVVLKTNRPYNLDHLARRIRLLTRTTDRILPARETNKERHGSNLLSREVVAPVREYQALRKAIRSNDVAAAREILDKNPELALARPKNELSALLVAGYARSNAIVRNLLGRGVLPDVFEAAVLGDTQGLTRILSEDRSAASSFSHDGWTPLHIAVGFGQLEAARILLDHGAPLDAVSRNGIRNQPLQAAVAGGHPPLVRLILKTGGNPEHRSHGGFTAAHLAAEGGDPKILELLLAGGADFAQAADGGKTPLDIATEHHQKAAVLWIKKNSKTAPK
jgi:uncharacterized protein